MGSLHGPKARKHDRAPAGAPKRSEGNSAEDAAPDGAEQN